MPSYSSYPLPQMQTSKDRLIFVDAASTSAANPVWDMLWEKKWPGHIAASITPTLQRVARLKDKYRLELNDRLCRPASWTPEWLEYLTENLYGKAAQMQLPGDYCPCLDVPGFVHGESQGLCDLFGAKVEQLPDGHHHVYPLAPIPRAIENIAILPIKQSKYWRAVEYIQYARGATQGVLPFHNPVMTGPIDTANYLLGTTVLLEWLYTEPQAVHSLLEKITGVLIEMVKAIKQAAGGHLCSHHLNCVRGGFYFCSEVRSLISPEMYEQFEAPYLSRIGEALGPFSAHSCGNWEKTVPSILRDPNFRAMNGQIKENDLAALCRIADGKLTLSIGRSVYVHDRFMWPDVESYYRYILQTVPEGQPIEITLESEEDSGLWNQLYHEICGKKFPWTPPRFLEQNG